MPPGKAASQAGHAFLDCFLQAPDDLAQAYLDGGGTKVVLVAPDEAALQRVYLDALEEGIVAVQVVDEHHVMPPHFDGAPILTAIGLGPVLRDQVLPVTGGLRTM